MKTDKYFKEREFRAKKVSDSRSWALGFHVSKFLENSGEVDTSSMLNCIYASSGDNVYESIDVFPETFTAKTGYKYFVSDHSIYEGDIVFATSDGTEKPIFGVIEWDDEMSDFVVKSLFDESSRLLINLCNIGSEPYTTLWYFGNIYDDPEVLIDMSRIEKAARVQDGEDEKSISEILEKVEDKDRRRSYESVIEAFGWSAKNDSDSSIEDSENSDLKEVTSSYKESGLVYGYSLRTVTEMVLEEVLKERTRQNEKWGQQDHNLTEWVAILTEEVGEVSKEACDYHFGTGLNGGISDTVGDSITQDVRLDRYREECIQVAAVAVQMVEALDRMRNWPL